MSATLFCLIKGNTSTNAFSIKINRDEPIRDYWTALPKRHIHIIVESPVPIATFYKKQRKTFSWLVDIDTVTLDSIKLAILKALPFLQDTKPEDLTLRFGKAEEKNCEKLDLEDDATFRQYLKSCALQRFLMLKVQIDTVQKPFSDWKLSKVCELLNLVPDIDKFSTFNCDINKLDSEKAKDLMTHFCKDLRLRYKAIHGKTEATRSEYVSPFFVTATSLFDSVVEVKKEDFDQGMAQNVIQLHSSLKTNQKRKHDEIKSDFADKAYGIVTDGRVYVHSGTPAVLDWIEKLEALDKSADRILGQIIWLLKEAEQWGKLNMVEKRWRINY
ncbi:41543_t:CDS:2 [Gigaspora margarita]|uniref:41543_t:CDS:1 n=1 Tax=Gigaspora margarita TaxID=4874 RepID=A0ABN7UN80_GIGMA|nr:41543_t:CDS:2 [Gigaspora margarita]